MRINSANNKYGVAPKSQREADGVTFHSKAERLHYQELKLLQKAGVIAGIRLQPRYKFKVGYWRDDFAYRMEKPMTYVGDFEYTIEKAKEYPYATVKDGDVIVDDVKGAITKEFKIKKELFRYFYPEYKLVLT